MKRGYFIFAVVVFLFLGVTSAQAATVMKRIPYEKQTNLSYPKTYTIRFSLWDAGTIGSGKQVWFEEKFIDLISSSTIKTELGSKNPLDNVDFRKQLWVQVERKKPDGSYEIVGKGDLTKRDRFKVVPYAMWSNQSGEPNPLPKFEGEICFTVHITEDTYPPYPDTTGLMRVRVTYTGGLYYLLQGFFIIPNNNPAIFDGTAVNIGNDIFMNLNFTWHDSSEMTHEGGSVQIRLGKSTLGGTIWSSVRQFDTVTREFINYYNAGTVTHRTCP